MAINVVNRDGLISTSPGFKNKMYEALYPGYTEEEEKDLSYLGGLDINRGILQSLTDKGKKAFGFLKDKGATIGGAVASGITGIPFLGTAFNALQRPGYPSDDMSKSFAYGNENAGNNYGYYNTLRHGNLTGQDQFGINTISMGENYPAYYDNYKQEIDEKKKEEDYKMSNFTKRKYAHAELVAAANKARIEKDFFTNDDNDGGGDVTYVPPVVNNNQNDGGAQFDGAPDRATYDRDPTAYSGSFKKGGRVGYFFGGLAARGMKR